MSQDMIRARSTNLAELVQNIWLLDSRDFPNHFNIVHSLLLLASNRIEIKKVKEKFEDFKKNYSALLNDYHQDPVLLEMWNSKQKLPKKLEAINLLSEIIQDVLQDLKTSGIDIWKTERGMDKV